jgi:hypothetical protein
MIRHQCNERYAFEGSDEDEVTSCTRYALVTSRGTPETMDPMLQYTHRCTIHGENCLGPLERLNDMIFLPYLSYSW